MNMYMDLPICLSMLDYAHAIGRNYGPILTKWSQNIKELKWTDNWNFSGILQLQL